MLVIIVASTERKRQAMTNLSFDRESDCEIVDLYTKDGPTPNQYGSIIQAPTLTPPSH